MYYNAHDSFLRCRKPKKLFAALNKRSEYASDNMNEALSAFNQGHQPDGSARKPKFLINKQNIDNYIVYSYEA